tara:strand:- start:26 stop:1120 length:1095 start_codon:yes stop_codon:yes gene_type:complete
MTTKVNYDTLGKFLDYDKEELKFDEVVSDIRNIDIDYGIDVIFKHYRKHGFPHYKITEQEKHEHMRKLMKFDHTTIINGDELIQTMHCLRLAWSYFPQFWKVKCGKAKMTPWDNFHDDEKLKKVIRKVWIYLQKFNSNRENIRFTENRFRQMLKMYEGTQAVSNFRPTAAKYIYETYGGEGVVWDMSSGWGGRLIGALASKRIKKYIGTEPSTNTFKGLKQLQKDFSYIDTKVELHKLGSEVFKPREKVDLCFTSPPYFDTEKYSDEPTQSYIKYPTEKEWIDGFLFQTIKNCYESLKKNGYLLLNIANTSSGKNIENGTLDITKGFNLKPEKTLKLSLSTLARGGDGTGFKYEPIYVFKKVGE